MKHFRILAAIREIIGKPLRPQKTIVVSSG